MKKEVERLVLGIHGGPEGLKAERRNRAESRKRKRQPLNQRFALMKAGR